MPVAQFKLLRKRELELPGYLNSERDKRDTSKRAMVLSALSWPMSFLSDVTHRQHHGTLKPQDSTGYRKRKGRRKAAVGNNEESWAGKKGHRACIVCAGQNAWEGVQMIGMCRTK